jgi:two-component system CheB/CheR fusion protein
MFVATVTGLVIAVAKAERDKAEASLHRSEERYRSLVLASAQVVWTTNAVGEVTDDLPTWRTFTGQSQTDMAGRGWAKMVHPDDVEQATRLWEHSLATGTPHENEFRVMSAGGAYRYVHARAVPVMKSDGTVREWIGTLSDVTARRLAEKEREEGSRRKDQFLAMLAHELRNPLAPIRSAVEVIRSSKGDRNLIESMCAIMVRQITHMSRLLDDLLDVSRITRGTIRLHRKAADLKVIVEQCLDSARILLEKKGVSLTTNLAAAPLPILVDVTRMEQVISNLLNNAVKFTPAGGQISVAVEREAEWAVLRVRDTGRGIVPDFLPQIFDLFTQADQSLARSEGGLGIGLTLVRNLVRMHDGVVEAHSEGSDRGSEFVVRLPLKTVAPSEPADNLRQPTSSTAKKRILVVEDNVDSAAALAAMLRLMGHESHVAHDGDEGIQKFGEVKPGVVLLDIGLPRISGYEVAERLRAGNPQLRLIALTGYGSDADRERARHAGFDDHLVKPVDFDALERMLAEQD